MSASRPHHEQRPGRLETGDGVRSSASLCLGGGPFRRSVANFICQPPLSHLAMPSVRRDSVSHYDGTVGALLGLAVGDALELAESIAERGLLDADDVARRYISWATTDGRGIGRATRAALMGASDAAEARRRASAFQARTGMGASNGTVMRCAPIGLAARDHEQARAAAAEDARLTHGHPATARASAALCTALVAIRQGEDPLTAASAEAHGLRELERALELAVGDDRDALASLAAGPAAGACWTTLSIGLCALIWLGDHASGVTWGVSLGGDTHTKPALAGALLGYRDGADAIPARWLKRLAQRDRLERAAAMLAPPPRAASPP